MGNVVIVTTMWDKVTPEEGSQRETELARSEDLFKPLLTAGAKMARYENRESALRVLDYLLRKNITTLQIVRELVEERKILVDTAAGKELQGNIRDFMRRRMKEIQDLEEEIRVATELKDRRTVNEIMGEKRNLEEEWGKLRAELGKLGHNLGWVFAFILFEVADDRSLRKSFAQHVRVTFVIFMTSLLELSKRNTSLSDLEWRVSYDLLFLSMF